jgi:hypothetical protein
MIEPTMAPKSNASLRHDAAEAERFVLEALEHAALMDTGFGGELAHERAAKAATVAAEANRQAGNETRARNYDAIARRETARASHVIGVRNDFLEGIVGLKNELVEVRRSLDANRDAMIFWAANLRARGERDDSFRYVLGVVFVVVLVGAFLTR